MAKGFRKSIIRGSIVELTVAAVTADAFGPIVNSLVGKVINSVIGGLLGEPNPSNTGEFHVGDMTIQSGTVLAALIAFLLATVAVHLALILPTNKLDERIAKRKGLNAEEAEISDEVRLLIEICNVLAGDGYVNDGGAASGGYTGGGYRQ